MINIICYITALAACLIGKICGMGGGVIIKPVLDAMNIADVSTINFISGCTVIGMTAWSVIKGAIKNEGSIDLHVSTPLAVGAALGGFLGKDLFSLLQSCFRNPDAAGGIQAALLFAATFGTLIYTVKKSFLRSYNVRNPLLCVLIGLGLGALGAFLGIGGGPFNMAVLFLFFTMAAKAAARNSLYIILISQLAAMLKLIILGSVPVVNLPLLAGMILFGILGSEIGGKINKRISDEKVTRLFECSMLLVMAICVYNMINFFNR